MSVAIILDSTHGQRPRGQRVKGPAGQIRGRFAPQRLARLGLARLGLARLGLARLGLARLGLARLASVGRRSPASTEADKSV